MRPRTALVLSGGGLFGAWQAGAWSELSRRFTPDLIVGASVGALNGYLIASRVGAAELHDYWLSPALARFSALEVNVRRMTEHYRPRTALAVTATDLLRMRPRMFQDGEIGWQHLAASCALPLLLPQRRIGGRWYSDGGLLNPVPVWAAVDLGATHIVALNALPEIPSPLLRPFSS